MEFKITDMRAVLFKNDYKKKDSQPDYVGKVNINNTEEIAKLAAWLKESKNGKKYLSIAFSDTQFKRQLIMNNGEPLNEYRAPIEKEELPDDEVPF